MGQGKTLVLGASTNPLRYSYRAIRALRQHKHGVYAIGLRDGVVDDVEIISTKSELKDVETITLYLSQKNQKQYYDYIVSLKPKRIIYNPGAENKELSEIAEKAGIQNVEACTLVLLATGQY